MRFPKRYGVPKSTHNCHSVMSAHTCLLLTSREGFTLAAVTPSKSALEIHLQLFIFSAKLLVPDPSLDAFSVTFIVSDLKKICVI